MRVLAHHIYEYEKGLRNLVLHTLPARLEGEALRRLGQRNIRYHVERVNADKINIYFGDPDCVEVVLRICRKPLARLTPEEDFMLGTMLGYGRLVQVKRYLQRKPLARLTPEEDFMLGTMLGYGRLVQVKRYLQRKPLAAAG